MRPSRSCARRSMPSEPKPSVVSFATKRTRGDVHPVTGLVYWDTFHGKERWRPAAIVAKWSKRQTGYVKTWQRINPVLHRAHQRNFRSIHGKRRNAEARGYRNEWKKRKRKSDPCYALKVSLGSRLRIAMKRKGMRKQHRTMSVLGCSIEFFKSYIESKFKPGMTWGNYGYRGWHLDHEYPLSRATSKQEIERLCHYTNIQPLWWYENFSKRAKIPT